MPPNAPLAADISRKNSYIVPMKLSEIVKVTGGVLSGDASVEITAASDLSAAKPGSIAFFEGTGTVPSTTASCVIVGPSAETNVPHIKVERPKLAFALIARRLHPRPRNEFKSPLADIAETATVKAEYIGPHVSIGENCSIAENVRIYPGVKIGADVTIGRGTIIFANAVIYEGTVIGSDCIIHAGCSIGADGFGYVRDEAGEYIPFPQLGGVLIEDRVEIGANTCVDRGALGNTRIGSGTKIDNLVQVGHNVDIGRDCVIAAQTGISGSVVIEDGCVIGGQVGFGDHVRVKSGAIIGSQAGVLPGKIVRPGVWWGTPIKPLDDMKRQNARLNAIERLVAEVKELKKKIDER